MTADSVDQGWAFLGICVAGIGCLFVVLDFLRYLSHGTGFVTLVSGAALQCVFGFRLRRSGAPRVAMANFAVGALSLALLVVLVAARARG